MVKKLAVLAVMGAIGPACVFGTTQPVRHIEYVYRCDAPTVVRVAQPPPPVRVEVRPSAINTRQVWIGGYWDWRGSTWDWVPGRYEDPRPGLSWIPPRYDSGNFQPGYWGSPGAAPPPPVVRAPPVVAPPPPVVHTPPVVAPPPPIVVTPPVRPAPPPVVVTPPVRPSPPPVVVTPPVGPPPVVVTPPVRPSPPPVVVTPPVRPGPPPVVVTPPVRPSPPPVVVTPPVRPGPGRVDPPVRPGPGPVVVAPPVRPTPVAPGIDGRVRPVPVTPGGRPGTSEPPTVRPGVVTPGVDGRIRPVTPVRPGVTPGIDGRIRPGGITTPGVVEQPVPMGMRCSGGPSPNRGVVGSNFTITGTGFGSDRSRASASVGNIVAAIRRLSDTSALIEVPPGTPGGTVTLRNGGSSTTCGSFTVEAGRRPRDAHFPGRAQ